MSNLNNDPFLVTAGCRSVGACEVVYEVSIGVLCYLVCKSGLMMSTTAELVYKVGTT